MQRATLVAPRVGILIGSSLEKGSARTAASQAIASALRSRGYDAIPLLFDASSAAATLAEARLDVAFLALHGRDNEGGCVQGLCELLGLPYTGSSVLATALATDRVKAKELFRLHNLATPTYYSVASNEPLDDWREMHGAFGFPVVVKTRANRPNSEQALALQLAELRRGIDDVLRWDRGAIVERFVEGAMVVVGLLDGSVLGVFERDDQGNNVPATRFSPTRLQGIRNLAQRAASVLGCRGAVLVSLVVTTDENEYVLDVTPQPELDEASTLTQIAQTAGYSFATLCQAIVAGATLHQALPLRETSALRRVVTTDTSSWHQATG